MNEIKTFNFKTAERGQEVTKEVYEHFLTIMPPISLRNGQGWAAGFQVGEAYNHVTDARTGRWRPLFATFTSSGDHYFYQGNNFAGEVDSRLYFDEKENF